MIIQHNHNDFLIFTLILFNRTFILFYFALYVNF